MDDDYEVEKDIWKYVAGTLLVWLAGLSCVFVICYGMVTP